MSDTSSQYENGYRQTEVGLVPADWCVLEIQQIAKLGSGTTPARAQKSRYFTNGDNYWVKTTDLNNSVINTTEDMVTALALKETCLQIYPIGTVLIAMYGGFNQIGRTGFLNVPAAVNQALVSIQVHKNLDSRYLLYMLNYKIEYWKSVASSSRKDPNITSSDVKSFKLALPLKKEEQKAIANALFDVDALLTSLEKLIAKKRAIKTAAMQQLLTGKKRLPPFDKIHTGYKQTELGEIPEDWEVKRLNSLLKENPKYGIGAAAVQLRGKLPVYLRITDISEDGFFRPTIKVGVDRAESSDYVLQKGDLVFARTGASVGKSYLYRNSDGKLVYAGFLIKVSPDPKVLNSEYLFQYASTNLYWDWVKITSMRSGQPGINGAEYGQMLLPIPKEAEQLEISTVLFDMDKEIEALRQRLNKTKLLKQGMMQELLTGRTRLV